MPGLSKRELDQVISCSLLSENLKANHDYYLLGEQFIDADNVFNVSQIETYPSVIWCGDTVKLRYAKAGDLRDYLNLTVIIRGEVIL